MKENYSPDLDLIMFDTVQVWFTLNAWSTENVQTGSCFGMAWT